MTTKLTEKCFRGMNGAYAAYAKRFVKLGIVKANVESRGKAVTIKVSASGYANVGGLKDGAVLADFAPVLTVNKVKTVLAIKTNLWFDRANTHAEGVGQANLVR